MIYEPKDKANRPNKTSPYIIFWSDV